MPTFAGSNDRDAPERTRILVRLARGGDLDAQGRLLLQFWPVVAQEVRRVAGDGSAGLTAEDLEQEAFAAVLPGLAGFTYRGRGSFEAWIRKVARHRVLDCLEKARARKRRPTRPVLHLTERLGAGTGAVGPVPAPGPTPSEVLQRREERDWIAEGIRRMRDPHRTALLLAYVEGLSCREIATRIGRPPEATRKLIGRAIDKLEKVLRGMRAGGARSEAGARRDRAGP